MINSKIRVTLLLLFSYVLAKVAKEMPSSWAQLSLGPSPAEPSPLKCEIKYLLSKTEQRSDCLLCF